MPTELDAGSRDHDGEGSGFLAEDLGKDGLQLRPTRHDSDVLEVSEQYSV